MKTICSLIIGLFFFQIAYSQTNKDYELMGTLQLSTQEIISFKLKFKEIENGKIEGSSLTDIFGSDRTASKIKGSVDWKKKKLSFYETENISTKSSAEAASFCYLHVDNASIKMVKGKTIIQGSFKGKFANGQSCTNGQLYLIGSDYINELAKKYLHSDYIKNEDSLKKMQQKYTDITAKIGDNYLRSNEALSLAWKGEEIIIEVWDARQEDGDEIAIYVNEKKVIDRFVIKQEKKTLVIPFPKKQEAIVRIHGLSEGNFRLCTANLSLRDDTNSTDVVAIMKKGENVIVKLKKEN
ncbi:MAG: hypothetical protein Q8R57_07770 [Bacteroidota bacterium]|nr:hypothetical protein [Bacteroidota bacterium]